jgi:hypothetical protein
MKYAKDLLWLLAGMSAWALTLLVLGIAARINWEIFMFGWNSI